MGIYVGVLKLWVGDFEDGIRLRIDIRRRLGGRLGARFRRSDLDVAAGEQPR